MTFTSWQFAVFVSAVFVVYYLPFHLAVVRAVCDTAWHELIVGSGSMTNAMLDARQEGGSYRRIELITAERQRVG